MCHKIHKTTILEHIIAHKIENTENGKKTKKTQEICKNILVHDVCEFVN